MGLFDHIPDEAQPAPAPAGLFDHIPDEPAPEGGIGATVKDAAKSAGVGYLKGVAGLVGLPADLARFATFGADKFQSWRSGRPYEEVRDENDRNAPVSSTWLDERGGAARFKQLEDWIGEKRGDDAKLHQPTTRAGRYADTVASFIPGAAIGGGGSALRSAVAYGVVPGIASEAAGQATEGTALEPWARGGAAIIGAGGSAFALRPDKVERTALASLKDLPADQVNSVTTKAQGLIDDARAMGVPLSTANAIDTASDGLTGLSALQGKVERFGGMRGFYAGMPEKVDRAARATFDTIAPPVTDAGQLGRDVQSAAMTDVALSPESIALSRAERAAPSRITPEKAGSIIQPELRRVFDKFDTRRATQAEADYGAARASASDVPIGEKMVDVTRTAERPMTPAEAAAAERAPPVDTSGPAPLTLSEYIAKNGGLSMDGGDAAAAGFDKVNVPFGGKLARPDGKSIDSHWRERLIEDGYLPYDHDGGMARDIRDELFDALHAERQGNPTYSAFDQDKVAARATKATEAENATALNDARSSIVRDHYRAGVKPSDLDPEVVERAAKLVAGGSEQDSLAAYQRAQAQAGRTVEHEVTEQVPQTIYGQASPNPVIQHITKELEFAKGSTKSDLERVRGFMFKPNGEVDGSVQGLHNAREEIGSLIEKAKAEGRGPSARELMRTQKVLDDALEQVPEYAFANNRFQKASKPLDPFGPDRAPGRIVAKDEFEQRFTMPPEKVPGAIDAGPSAARDMLKVGTPGARSAYERHLTTRLIDGATEAGDLSADALRAALRDNADQLAQFPNVQRRLEAIAVAKDGLDRMKGTVIGKLAQHNPDVGKTAELLFPMNPTPGTTAEVAGAVSKLAAQNPWAARQLVRVHAESTFNEATQALASGPNAKGGSEFASAIRGNSEQAKNLEAGVKALPEGDAVWSGFNKFLDVMEAGGRRQGEGSATAMNQQFASEMKIGGLGDTVVRGIVSGGLKLPGKFLAKMDDWRLGRNVDELARLFSDPDAIGAFKGLLKAPNPTGATGRLVAIAMRGAQDAGRPLTLNVSPSGRN